MSDNRATRAHIAASRGHLHEYLSTDAALTDETADALMRNVAGQPEQFDTGTVHGPDRPEIIAHRYWCPSCDAQPGEPCRLSPRFTQDYSHESRHQGARRAMWRALSRDMDISVGWSVGPRDPWGSDPDRTTRNWRPESAR